MLNVDLYTTGNPEFLNYLCKKSQYGMFALPNLSQKGFSDKIRFNKEFQRYYDNCIDLITAIEPHLIGHYVSNRFIWGKYKHALDIYIFIMNKNFRQLASKKGPLSNWVQPDLPEDLCLLNSNKEPILLTQTHEAACEIYQETESEMKLFSMQGVAFQHFSNREPNLGWGYRDFSRR